MSDSALTGTVAVVTGASSGIGEATAAGSPATARASRSSPAAATA